MKKVLVLILAMLLNTSIALAFVPTNASTFSISMLNSNLKRLMVSYSKGYGETGENLMLDVYGDLEISFEKRAGTYEYLTHYLKDQNGATTSLRFQATLNSEEAKRFRECMSILSVNQAKRELTSTLTTGKYSMAPGTQLSFQIEAGSSLETTIRNWGFSDLTKPNAVVPANNSQDKIYFIGCTANF